MFKKIYFLNIVMLLLIEILHGHLKVYLSHCRKKCKDKCIKIKSVSFKERVTTYIFILYFSLLRIHAKNKNKLLCMLFVSFPNDSSKLKSWSLNLAVISLVV